jgi:predicted P-loop ATPase
VGKRELNTFCLDAHAAGISCWDKDVNRYIYSTRIPSYNPFRLYMSELPAWDGVDRLAPLARRVSDRRYWVAGFHRWMLGVAAQWMGRKSKHANSVAPILVSSEQGHQKSTFCRSLMPEALERYYMDNFKITSQGQAERMMAEMGLISMDEFDKFPAGQMPLLKNLMQMPKLTIRKAYQTNFNCLDRLASFIGTSNRFDLLSDPTGSRRFLCVEVKKPIDSNGIEHAQIYAQLKAELAAGERAWFDKAEESAMQQQNLLFGVTSLAEDLFYRYFRLPEPGENSLEMTAADIFGTLKKHHAALLHDCSSQKFAQMLIKVGLTRRHTEYGNVYKIMRREKT